MNIEKGKKNENTIQNVSMGWILYSNLFSMLNFASLYFVIFTNIQQNNGDFFILHDIFSRYVYLFLFNWHLIFMSQYSRQVYSLKVEEKVNPDFLDDIY